MKIRNSARGATVLETALVLPILFILLFAIMEFGRAYNIFTTVTNAAREGARYSVAPIATGFANAGNQPTVAQVQADVQYFLRGDGIVVPDSNIVVVQNCTGTTACPIVNGIKELTYSQVTVTAPYQFIYFPAFGTVNLSSRAVMRNE
jgi:Flp pilus assembly protein TadG